jgi:hypothetical protein
MQISLEQRYTSVVVLSKRIPVECIRIILKYDTIDWYDISHKVWNQLQTTLRNGQYNSFKQIYDREYMDPRISNWFKFPEEEHDWYWNIYDLCECDTQIEKVWKREYDKRCSCKNGKRFLAFKCLYDETREFIQLTQKKTENSSQLIMNHLICDGVINMKYTSMFYD